MLIASWSSTMLISHIYDTPRQHLAAHHSEVRQGMMRGLTVVGDRAHAAARGGVGTWQ
jgi:hypothetical protein